MRRLRAVIGTGEGHHGGRAQTARQGVELGKRHGLRRRLDQANLEAHRGRLATQAIERLEDGPAGIGGQGHHDQGRRAAIDDGAVAGSMGLQQTEESKR